LLEALEVVFQRSNQYRLWSAVTLHHLS
jgi:hypothetical protein